MKCPRCGGKMEKKTGEVYGQPSQKTEYEKCLDCGIQTATKVSGLYLADSVDVQEGNKNAPKSKNST